MVASAWSWWAVWGLFMVFFVFSTSLWVPSRWNFRTRRYDGNFRDYSDWNYPYGMLSMPSSSTGKHKGRGPRGYRRSDERIAEDINDKLMMHNEIDPTDVQVHVKNGEATLSGTIESRHEKRIAEALADSVPGVTDVKNILVISNKANRQDKITAA